MTPSFYGGRGSPIPPILLPSLSHDRRSNRETFFSGTCATLRAAHVLSCCQREESHVRRFLAFFQTHVGDISW